MITTDKFIDKFYKELLTDEDLEDINYLINFKDTSSTYFFYFFRGLFLFKNTYLNFKGFIHSFLKF